MLRRVATRDSYLGAGIDVDPRWHDVGVFIEDIEATLGDRPDGLSLDRVDNDRGYWIWNVRWATPLQQAHNRGHSQPAEGSDAESCLLLDGLLAREFGCFVHSCDACPLDDWQ